MTDPSRPPTAPQPPQIPRGGTQGVPQGILHPGTVVPSMRYPGGRSIVVEERPNYNAAHVVDERTVRDWVR